MLYNTFSTNIAVKSFYYTRKKTKNGLSFPHIQRIYDNPYPFTMTNYSRIAPPLSTYFIMTETRKRMLTVSNNHNILFHTKTYARTKSLTYNNFVRRIQVRYVNLIGHALWQTEHIFIVSIVHKSP